MRSALLGFVLALVLAGCASTLDNAYDEDQRRQCERDNRGVERVMC